MMQDSIDFGTMNIPKLFRMMFIPTLLGMILSATINIADGIFVGRGVGNDALAAVNIVAPFFMLATGIGLMFGVGASIVASIHLYPVRRITYIRHVMQRYPGPDKPNIRLYFRFPIALGINGSRFSFRYFRNRRKYYDRGLYRRFF